MYANYVMWGGGSGGPEDDFFPVGVGRPNKHGNFLEGEKQTAQDNL